MLHSCTSTVSPRRRAAAALGRVVRAERSWGWLERAERGSSHAVDCQLVLPLDALLSLPGQFGRVEHRALDNHCLEVACCRWGDAVLADDPAKPRLGLTGLTNLPAMVLCEGEIGFQPDPKPACGLQREVDGLAAHLDALNYRSGGASS